MTGLEVLLAVVGIMATVLVVVGMILITPRGEVDLHGEVTDPQGSELSRADTPRPRMAGGRSDRPIPRVET